MPGQAVGSEHIIPLRAVSGGLLKFGVLRISPPTTKERDRQRKKEVEGDILRDGRKHQSSDGPLPSREKAATHPHKKGGHAKPSPE